MKRQLIAVVLGSAFALPAFANYEIYATGVAPAAEVSAKSREQVRAEIVAAKRTNDWRVNAALGTQNQPSVPALAVGKSRAQVRAEVAQARAAGDYIANAELGTTARQL